MADILKGNFTLKNAVEVPDAKAKTLEEQFEKEALQRLGGSIAFVSKKKVLWDSDGSDEHSRRNTEKK